jgi:SpoU rRNA methylase family enzyme
MLVVVLAEPQGYKTIEDFARLVYELFSDSMLVLLNPQGAALQNGLPVLSKIALEKQRKFAVVARFSELLELFPQASKIYIVRDAKEDVSFNDLLPGLDYSKETIILVFPSHPTRELVKDKDLKDKIVYVNSGLPSELTVSTKAAILLYKLWEKHEGSSSV